MAKNLVVGWWKKIYSNISGEFVLPYPSFSIGICTNSPELLLLNFCHQLNTTASYWLPTQISQLFHLVYFTFGPHVFL